MTYSQMLYISTTTKYQRLQIRRDSSAVFVAHGAEALQNYYEACNNTLENPYNIQSLKTEKSTVFWT